MRTTLTAGLVPALLILAAAGCAAAPAAGGDAPWRSSPLWDDGNAELCAYEVTWARYGNLWEGRALLILVKEPWAPDLDVKADEPRPDGFDVLKLNHVRDVPTGIYTYHQMASVFLRRETGELVKLATTSSEACGISTAFLVDGTLDTHSYFDGQGSRSTAWPRGALPEDGLPALLRDFVAGALPREVEVFPSLLTGRLPDLQAESFRLERRPLGEVTVPAGSFSAVELRLERGDRFLSYVFEDREPYRLLRLERSDGTEYRLAKCGRIPYWNMARPGAEAWYPEAVR